jgi:lysophospholipase L1-like esterase
VEQFKRNLKDTISQAKNFGSKILILNITPVNEELTANSVNKDKSQLNKYIEMYNKNIREVADDLGIYFVDVNSAFMSNDYKSLFCEDGLHPNESGHETIFKELLKTIGPIIGLGN